MHPVRCSAVIIVLLSAACVEGRDDPHESSAQSAVIVGNRLGSQLVSNHAIGTQLSTQKVASTQLGDTTYAVNLATAKELVSSEDGREVLSFIIGCALPSTITLEVAVGGTTFEFFGELGIAPEWLSEPLTLTGQRRVSACMFARMNANDVAVAVSMRGPSPALSVDSDERDAFTLQEGAFFGNYFTGRGQPIAWYACRGSAQAQGDQGDLQYRECAEPDPDHPGLTKCGFNYAGDCGAFAPTHACEQYSDGDQYYQRCRTAPFHKRPSPYEPVFPQVVTTYMMP